jgi:aerobic-type carbon monoxide dehydrogenase small subunit (CoxS/CutS family)
VAAETERGEAVRRVRKQWIQLRVNGNLYELAVTPNRLLLEVLREDLGLTGTKRGCDDSSCGCCTVLIDGRPALACVALAASYESAEITTIEGLAQNGELDPVQQAFMETGGAQCGFCTPGFILTARAFLARNPSPTLAEIREALAGNLCRCTGYTQIYEAVLRAARLLEERARQPAVREAGENA